MRALLFDAQKKKKKKKISGLHQFVVRIISIISNVSLFKKIFENRPLFSSGIIEKRESDRRRTSSLSRETKSRRELIIRNERRWSMAVPLKAGNCWREGEGGGAA